MPSLGSSLQTLMAKAPNPELPTTPSFWNGRPNELTFVDSVSDYSVRGRHHVQIWNSGVSSGSTRIWVGTAHLDRDASNSSSLPLMVHAIDPFVDRERQHLRQSFETAGSVRSSSLFSVSRETPGKNFAGGPVVTDGNACLLIAR